MNNTTRDYEVRTNAGLKIQDSASYDTFTDAKRSLIEALTRGHRYSETPTDDVLWRGVIEAAEQTARVGFTMLAPDGFRYELRKKPAKPIYVAMWNLPGFLLDMEPLRTLDETEAREFLADALEEVAEFKRQAGVEDNLAMKAAKNFRDGSNYDEHVGSYTYSLSTAEPENDEEARKVALAQHLDCSLDDVEELTYGSGTMFEAESEDWLILTDEEADTMAHERIKEDLWAFRAEFLLAYMPDGMTVEAIQAIQEQLCEDASPSFLSMVGDRLDELVSDAICSDGRGHFLSSYDGNEVDSKCGNFVMFRLMRYELT